MEGWELKPVSDIAQHSLGKMLDKSKNKGELRDYLRNTNVRWFEFDLTDMKQMRFLPEEEEKYTAEKGDVLICEGGYPGRAAIWCSDEPIHFQKALHRVRFHEPTRNIWFLYYLFYMDVTGKLREFFTGSGIQHFTGRALARLPIPLPPLPEQERIVAILDEAFAAIATATANAEKNLANARELEPSTFHFMLEDGDSRLFPTTIGDQIQLQRGFDITKKQQIPGPVPVVSSGGIKSFHSKAMVVGPGVVIGRKGSIGRVHFVTDDYWPHDTTLWVKDFMGNNPKFVYRFLTAIDLASLDSGTANPALNRNMIHPLPTSWPSVDLQDEIVNKTDEIASQVQTLERSFTEKLAALTELKQSILQKAFTGELTADPGATDRTLAEAGA